MRLVVLGGTGFLGAQVVSRLRARGHEVALFRRGQSMLDFRRLMPDVVVDARAFIAEHAESLVDAFRGIGARVVLLSSGDVYRANDVLQRRVDGPLEPTPLHESSPLRSRLYPYRGVPIPREYGFDWDEYEKILVERVVMSAGDPPATVLRLPMVYGPNARDAAQRRFLPYLQRMDASSTITIDASMARWLAPWGYSEDVAEAVRLAVENPQSAGQVYNVCDPDALDLQTWLRELADATGWRGEFVSAPGPPGKLNFEQHLDMDSSKIRRELGYRETMSRRESLERTVAWERAHPVLGEGRRS